MLGTRVGGVRSAANGHLTVAMGEATMFATDGEIPRERHDEHHDETDADAGVDRVHGITLPRPDAEIERHGLAAIHEGEPYEEDDGDERSGERRDPTGSHEIARRGSSTTALVACSTTSP